MNDENNRDHGCGCGCDFRKEVDELVKEGQKPTPMERMEKKREVEDAFGKDAERSDSTDCDCGK